MTLAMSLIETVMPIFSFLDIIGIKIDYRRVEIQTFV